MVVGHPGADHGTMNDVDDHRDTDPTDPTDDGDLPDPTDLTDLTDSTDDGDPSEDGDPSDLTDPAGRGWDHTDEMTADDRTSHDHDVSATPAPARRLMRSRDRRIAGVAGGVAEYFAIDPVIVRLGFVVAVFAGGTGLIAYAIAWLVLPEAHDEPPDQHRRPVDRSTIVALGLLAIAVILGLSDPFDGGVVVPVLLIGAGVYLLHQRPLDEKVPATPTSPARPGTLVDAPEGAVAWRPGDGRLPPPPPPPTIGDHGRTTPPPREPAVVTRLTLSLLALWFAGAIAFDQLGWIDADGSAVAAIGLVVVGAASLIASVVGGGRGLIPLGLVLALALGTAIVIEPVIEDGVGDREHAVTTIESLEPAYRLGIGRLEVDLSALTIPAGETATIEVELGIGEAILLIPPDVDLRLDGEVGMGELVILGDEEAGIGNRLSVDADSDETTATLVVDLNVGIGSGRIDRG